MALQVSATVRNAKLDSVETTIGTAAKVRIYSGAAPASLNDLVSGTLLVEMNLPVDWMGAAASGSKTKLGTWSGTGTVGAGAGTNAGYFRLLDSAGTTAHMQGNITITGGGGDMTLDNLSIAQDQTVTVNTFTLNEANAAA
jgi:hypothetical protein